MDSKIKHLEFIQSNVARMASNLFLLKGWTITLLAALFALAAKDSNQGYALLAYFPLLIFWALDGYFLAHERRFRALYDEVRKQPESNIDFSMDTSRFNGSRYSAAGAMFSHTGLWYYGPLLLVTFIVMMSV